MVKWPWTREAPGVQRIVIVHEIPALSELAAAMRYAARKDHAARVREAKLRRPDITRPKPSKLENPDPPEWATWQDANDHRAVEEVEHLKWAYDVIRGAEKVPEEQRLEAIVLYQRAQIAGYGLPDVDARAAMFEGNGKAP